MIQPAVPHDGLESIHDLDPEQLAAAHPITYPMAAHMGTQVPHQQPYEDPYQDVHQDPHEGHGGPAQALQPQEDPAVDDLGEPLEPEDLASEYSAPDYFEPLELIASEQRCPALSIVIPVFDEERALDASLSRLVAALERIDPDFEVVCVNDGSRDGTGEILAHWAAHDPRFEVFTLGRNRGKGAAVRTGVFAARGARVVCMDADLSTDLAGLVPLIATLDGGADVALGSRRAPGAELALRQPALREALGCGFTTIARWIVGAEVTDFTCGFKGFRRRAAREVFGRCELDGWAFDAELIAASIGRGFNVIEVPVRWEHRGSSKVRLIRALPAAAFDLLRVGVRRALHRYS